MKMSHHHHHHDGTAEEEFIRETPTIEIPSLPEESESTLMMIRRSKRTPKEQQGSSNHNSKKDASRHRFHTKVSLIMAGSFMVALTLLSVLFGTHHQDETNSLFEGDPHQQQQPEQQERLLEDNAAAMVGGDYDFSTYSCNELYTETSSDNMEQRCAFAQTCNQGAGIFAPIVFCRTNMLSTTNWCLVLSPFLTIWLVLLFRMLGSTAEDYFSPSLEMFALKLGLPPRFAGVSLLALGNGAADVSATISAITNDPQNGYHISLGALTGSGMFIGCVVAGAVIFTAEGVNCRGALVRDVCMLMVTVLVVAYILWQGSIGPHAITLLFSLYLAFVLIVLIADIYHRTVVLPRIALRNQAAERQRQLEEGQRAQEAAGMALDDVAREHSERVGSGGGGGGGIATSSDEMDANSTNPFDDNYQEPKQKPIKRAINTVLAALSNYDKNEGATGTSSREAGGWGVESDDVLHERPIVLHGANGVLNRHNQHNPPTGQINLEESEMSDISGQSLSPYRVLEDSMDQVCVAPDGTSYSAHNWFGALHDAKQELYAHAQETWADIVDNEESNKLDKFLLICELPFTFSRKITVPIPCEGYYCRALVALSIFLSSFWVGLYVWVQHETNLFWHKGLSYVGLMAIPTSIIAMLLLRYAPGGEGNLTLLVSAPIALYGFVMAATWIDTVADHLVAVLDFLGILFRIPGSIMGLTILAWGNSMGDLSADVTMARKGLANMAMTACFAGPVFNILIGLGMGFSTLSSITGEAETQVTPTASTIAGIVFNVINTAMLIIAGVFVNKGRIPKSYGYAAVTLYVVYVVTCVWLTLA